MYSQHDCDVSIKSSRHLPGWLIAGRPVRTKFADSGYILKPDACVHREFKPKMVKKAIREPPKPPVYSNSKFTPWQHEMADYIHSGYNVIVDVVTSCGKTWAANLIVAYETLSRDSARGAKSTALFISPNSEIMRDSVRDIAEHHTKHYNHSTKMMDTITRNYATYDDRRAPVSQLMVVAVECLEEFITDPVNEAFVRNLQIIVFDEVHLGPVARGLWWSKYIPHTAQLVLLSATLGDPEEIRTIVGDIQKAQDGRPMETKIITYNIRPIPLQPLLFKGCPAPDGGIESKNLKNAGRLACVINQFDPTVRDIASLGVTGVEGDRERQYILGQKVVAENMGVVHAKLDSALETAETEATPESVYNLLCYLFANDKAPAMVFNTTSGATEELCKGVISHIAGIEAHDPEFCEASKLLATYEKSHHRARDNKDQCKSRERDRDNWQKALPDDAGDKVINIYEVNRKIGKWRFPNDTQAQDNMPQWIKDALSYGIGVYIGTMKVWQRHFIFDAFRNGSIKVLFSDSSISVGINLPIRTVVMCGSISHALYKQASGRAGRRGMDDQGYIVHLMPKEDILHHLTTDVPEVHLKMPNKMTHSDLLRLLVPSNLDRYYGESDVGHGSSDFTRAEPISIYADTILTNYLKTLSVADGDACRAQIDLMHKEQWHYHRLTNMIKTLPEASSIVMMKLLSTGALSSFDSGDLINLIALLFQRGDAPLPSANDPTAYYVPSFSTDIIKDVQAYSDAYGFTVDYSQPIHRYFYDFCRKQIVHMDYLAEIEAMGEWLYLFKRGVTAIAPHKVVKGPDGHKHIEMCDRFAVIVEQVDRDYLSARTCRSI